MKTIIRDSFHPLGYDATEDFTTAGYDPTRNVECTVIDGKVHYWQADPIVEPEPQPVPAPKKGKKVSKDDA